MPAYQGFRCMSDSHSWVLRIAGIHRHLLKKEKNRGMMQLFVDLMHVSLVAMCITPFLVKTRHSEIDLDTVFVFFSLWQWTRPWLIDILYTKIAGFKFKFHCVYSPVDHYRPSQGCISVKFNLKPASLLWSRQQHCGKIIQSFRTQDITYPRRFVPNSNILKQFISVAITI